MINVGHMNAATLIVLRFGPSVTPAFEDAIRSLMNGTLTQDDFDRWKLEMELIGQNADAEVQE